MHWHTHKGEMGRVGRLVSFMQGQFVVSPRIHPAKRGLLPDGTQGDDTESMGDRDRCSSYSHEHNLQRWCEWCEEKEETKNKNTNIHIYFLCNDYERWYTFQQCICLIYACYAYHACACIVFYDYYNDQHYYVYYFIQFMLYCL